VLRSLHIEGFKAYEAEGIPLRPFTVLIGPNGAGKTTILEAIDVLGRLVTGTIKDLLEAKSWEYGDLPHLRAATKEFGIAADFTFDGAPVRWVLHLGARRRPGISHELVFQPGKPGSRGVRKPPPQRVWLTRKGRRMTRWAADGTGESISQTLTSSWLSAIDEEDRDRFPELLQVANWARRIRGYFFLDPLKLRSPSRGEGDEIGVNGESLAPFLARLKDRDRAAFERVQKRVQKHYPRLVELHPVRRGYGWTHLEVTERWNGETARFNARQVSDGLLRIIAVAAMHELPISPSVLLLDEIENGLHPQLLGGFVKMLQDLVRSKRGQTQIVLATHSPITVNFCESPDDVLLVTRGRGGHPTCTPLSKTRGFEKLRAHFDLGELWYNVGEQDLVR
jgi:predicted ATPase